MSVNLKKSFAPMAKADLAKEITSIGKTGNKLNIRIQIAALNAVYYSIAEGYIQYGDNLVTSLTNGHRKNTLVAFLEKFGQFQWSKEKKGFNFKKRTELTLESIDSISEQWYETIKAPDVISSIDVESKFEQWLKTMNKQAAEVTNVQHKELIAVLAKAHADWHEAQALLEDDDDSVEEIKSLMELAVNADRKELRAA